MAIEACVAADDRAGRDDCLRLWRPLFMVFDKQRHVACLLTFVSRITGHSILMPPITTNLGHIRQPIYMVIDNILNTFYPLRLNFKVPLCMLNSRAKVLLFRHNSKSFGFIGLDNQKFTIFNPFFETIKTLDFFT